MDDMWLKIVNQLAPDEPKDEVMVTMALIQFFLKAGEGDPEKFASVIDILVSFIADKRDMEKEDFLQRVIEKSAMLKILSGEPKSKGLH